MPIVRAHTLRPLRRRWHAVFTGKACVVRNSAEAFEQRHLLRWSMKSPTQQGMITEMTCSQGSNCQTSNTRRSAFLVVYEHLCVRTRCCDWDLHSQVLVLHFEAVLFMRTRELSPLNHLYLLCMPMRSLSYYQGSYTSILSDNFCCVPVVQPSSK